MKKFILRPDSIICIGNKKSIIVDLHFGSYYQVPNTLIVLFNTKTPQNLDDIIINHNIKGDNIEILQAYYSFLLSNDLLLFTDNIDLYCNPELIYYYPSEITNAICDISIDISHIKDFITQIDNLNCKVLQLRILSNLNPKKILELLRICESTELEWVELILPFNEIYNSVNWLRFFSRFKRTRNLIIYNAPKDSVIYYDHYSGDSAEFSIFNYTSMKQCGCISRKYFSTTLRAISESYNFNSCLNKKISIDFEGNIKNCPSMIESFGNIKDTTLMEAIAKPGYKKYWNINKDKIHVCKDCEFRYVCTDCRAYVEDPEDILSKPLKCGYNPYTGEWSEWSTNPLKQKAINYYGMQELVVERKKNIE